MNEETILHLIKHNNESLTISNNMLKHLLLQNPTKADFEKHGMEKLSGLTENINKHLFLMKESREESFGKIFTLKIDNDTYNIKNLSAKKKEV